MDALVLCHRVVDMGGAAALANVRDDRMAAATRRVEQRATAAAAHILDVEAGGLDQVPEERQVAGAGDKPRQVLLRLAVDEKVKAVHVLAPCIDVALLAHVRLALC